MLADVLAAAAEGEGVIAVGVVVGLVDDVVTIVVTGFPAAASLGVAPAAMTAMTRPAKAKRRVRPKRIAVLESND